MATHIGPSQDHPTVKSSVCYPNIPFQGTLNAVLTSTSQNHTSCSVPQVDAQNGHYHVYHISLASLTSPIGPSQGSLNAIRILKPQKQLPISETVVTTRIGHSLSYKSDGSSVFLNCPSKDSFNIVPKLVNNPSDGH